MPENFKAPILLKLMGATGMGLELSIIPINAEGLKARWINSYWKIVTTNKFYKSSLT